MNLTIIKQNKEFEIYELIKRIHRSPDDFINGDISERIESYKYYNLIKNFDLSILNPNEWDIDEYLVDEIVDMINKSNVENMPPIVISSDYSIIDGIHRLNALLNLRITYIDLYIGTNKIIL